MRDIFVRAQQLDSKFLLRLAIGFFQSGMRG